jgi:DNA end-binding protein Ku
MATKSARASPILRAVRGEPKPQAVALATQLIKRESGAFQPEKMPDQYAAALHELLRAKIEHRAPEVTMEPESKPTPEVINIMTALKKSIEAKGRAKVPNAVRKRMGKAASEREAHPRPSRSRPRARQTAH